MDEQNKKIMFWVIGAIVVTGFLAWIVFKNDTPNEEPVDHNGPGRISGELIFDALTPEDGDEGAINFAVRKHNTGTMFAPAIMAIEPSFTNGGTWMIDQLEENVAYDVQATLTIDNEEITRSEIVTTTAPASDVSLTLTVTWSDLPERSIKDSKNKTIAGTLAISGYIPEGAFYSIFAAPSRDNSNLAADEVDEPKFVHVLTNQNADVKNSWVWNTALAQVEYRIKAELYAQDGSYIGTSDIQDAAVPQNNVSLGLKSSAQTEPVAETISGEVNLNGSYKSDSTISVQVRVDGAGGFTEVDSFPAESNRDWVYTNAKAGVEYDVRAVLQRKGEDVSTSKQVHTTAPADDVDLKIDTGMNIVTPSTEPDVVSCDKRDDGKYDAELHFPGINSAEAYWVRVGTQKYGANNFNEPETPNDTGSDLTITVRIDDEKYYYTDYAYSYCKDCTTLDSFSDFSDHLKFWCGDEPEDD